MSALASRWPRPAMPSNKVMGLLGVLTLLGCVLLAISQGAYGLLIANWHQGGAEVLWHIRAPRVLMGVVAGMALGVSGALIQGLFRNPLADPGLIGVSSGAALGAGLMIVVGWQWLGARAGPWALMVAAFAGALLVTALTWRLARREGQVQITRLLLVGIAINAGAGSALGLLSHLADDEQLRSLTFWLLGSLGGSQWPAVSVCTLVVVLALSLPLWHPAQARALNVLSLGDTQAQMLGVNVQAVQRVCLVCVALSVGAVTALVGMVAFVGLLAPHAVRLLAGPDHRVVIPGSALIGACLVLLADTGARTLVAPAELPLGVLAGFIGAPAFVLMLHRRTALA